MDNIRTLIEREVVFVKKLIPKRYEIIERLVPVEFTEAYGKYIPTKFWPVPRYIPTDYEEIEVPILVPKL